MTTAPATLATAMPSPRVEPGTRRGEGLGLTVDALAVLALVAFWFVAQTLFLSGLSESRAQTVLYHQFRSELAAATAPTGGAIAEGSPVALLTIPELGLEQVVVEGTASGDLLSGPGHRRDTALPGQQGISLVYGRASTYGAPFARITTLGPGSQIVARTQQGKATFRVDDVRRAGDPVPQPPAPGQARLTLVSAEGAGPLAALAPRSTVYVDATLVGKAFVATPGRPPAVAEAEHAMAVDAGALPLLTLCLAAVIAAAAAAVAARQRRAGMVVWVVFAPIVMALAWATTDVGMRLLPNLM